MIGMVSGLSPQSERSAELKTTEPRADMRKAKSRNEEIEKAKSRKRRRKENNDYESLVTIA